MPYEDEDETFTFPAVHLPKFADGISKLAKIATKLGVPPITYTETAREVREETETLPNGDTVTAEIVYVTVQTSGTSPKIAEDYEYVGTVEHMPEGITEDGTKTANILHGDDAALGAYRHADATCEHCHYKRNRAKTVIARNVRTGNLVQIGTTCLKDYFGFHGNPAYLVQMLDVYAEMRDELDGERYGTSYADGTATDVFLSAVCACVRVHGWTARSAYSGTPTADLVQYVLGERTITKGDTETARYVQAVTVTDADIAEAKLVRAFALGIDSDTDNNYLGNVRAALSADYVLRRHYGIAASAVSARAKAEEREIARAVREGNRAASVHVGNVGERLETDVTVTFVRAFDNDYGTSYLVEMTDADGNILKTFSSGAFGYNAERGKACRIRGTVKAHEEWNGENATVLQTMLTRVKEM